MTRQLCFSKAEISPVIPFLRSTIPENTGILSRIVSIYLKKHILGSVLTKTAQKSCKTKFPTLELKTIGISWCQS